MKSTPEQKLWTWLPISLTGVLFAEALVQAQGQGVERYAQIGAAMLASYIFADLGSGVCVCVRGGVHICHNHASQAILGFSCALHLHHCVYPCAAGIYHWAVDNYGGPDTPVWGKQIAGFQGHHRRWVRELF